jgi:hypothetical protein
MGRFFNFGSRLILEILPSVAATVIGGYLLTQLHFGHTTEPATPSPQAVAAPADTTEIPTVREDRAAMREVLKERRENPELPAIVRPVVTAAPPPQPAPDTVPAAPVTAQLPAAMDSIPPNEPVDRAAAPSRPSVAVTPVAVPRARPEPVASVYAPAPPPGLPQAPALGPDAPLQVAPAAPAAGPVVAAQPPAVEAPQRRGVFSTFSSIVGGAASATGNTVNWVIDLPGKAIDAGGRVIGINPPPPNRPFS